MGKHSNFGRIADDVYYFSGFDNDVGAGFLATEEGIVVIDTTLLLTSASSLIGMIETLYPDDEIGTIINTHGHPDHHFGNETFAIEFPNAEIIAHEKFMDVHKQWTEIANRRTEQLTSTPFYHQFYFEQLEVIAPTKAVPSDTTFRFGDTTIELLHTPGHTEDHLTIYLPKQKILFAGDSIFTDRNIPVLFWGDIDFYVQSLERLLDFDIDILLPSHGPIPDSAHVEIEEHIGKIRNAKERVIEAARQFGREFSYSQLMKKTNFLKETDLQGIIRTLVRRGIVEADREDFTVAKLAIKG